MSEERIDHYLYELDAAADYAPEGAGLDGDDLPISCPYCGHFLDVLSAGRWACGNCEVAWIDPATIERARRELAAYPEKVED